MRYLTLQEEFNEEYIQACAKYNKLIANDQNAMTDEEKAYHQEQIAVAYALIEPHQPSGPDTHSSRLSKQLLNKLNPVNRLRRGLVKQCRHVDQLEANLFDPDLSKSEKSSLQAEVCLQ